MAEQTHRRLEREESVRGEKEGEKNVEHERGETETETLERQSIGEERQKKSINRDLLSLQVLLLQFRFQ